MNEMQIEIAKSIDLALSRAKDFIKRTGIAGMGLPVAQGYWTVFSFDKRGRPKGFGRGPNGNTTVGLTAMLDSFLRNQTQPATWYIGLVDNSGFTAFSPSDTSASHGGWTENQNYDEATRVAWSPNAAAAAAITNTTTSDFTISATVAIKGGFLISVSTKGGTTGTLYATGAFGSVQSLVDNDVLKASYSSTLTPS